MSYIVLMMKIEADGMSDGKKMLNGIKTLFLRNILTFILFWERAFECILL